MHNKLTFSSSFSSSEKPLHVCIQCWVHWQPQQSAIISVTQSVACDSLLHAYISITLSFDSPFVLVLLKGRSLQQP